MYGIRWKYTQNAHYFLLFFAGVCFLLNEIEKFANFNFRAVNSFLWAFSGLSHLIWFWQLAQYYLACDIWALKTQRPKKGEQKNVKKKKLHFLSVFSASSIHFINFKTGPNQKYNFFIDNFNLQAPKWVGSIEKFTAIVFSRSNFSPLSEEDFF